jgi:hypothetical protein
MIKYIDVQGNRRYYFDPDIEMKRGKESIIDFAHYVLDSIRRGNSAELMDYKVSTDILTAERYR